MEISFTLIRHNPAMMMYEGVHAVIGSLLYTGASSPIIDLRCAGFMCRQ